MSDIYKVPLFKQEGFYRKRCKSCGRVFWTLDPERETCGDTPCDEYTFIGSPATKRKFDLPMIETTFLKFFEKQGHEIVPRCPVVARWRDDIFLTIASIANFQPWVTNGLVPPPANPLVVSQPSIRLNDIDNVGRSGRHFTLFFMGGHHAFNSPSKRVYWTGETVTLCHEFLTRDFGVRPEDITYIQDWWEGGGNAGEDFEVNVKGLELITLVFMRYSSERGKYRPLPLKIVDTGYGLERLVWISSGATSSYEVVFKPVVEKLRKISGVELPPLDVLREHSKLAGMMDVVTGRDLRVLRENVAKRTGITVEDLNRLMEPLEAVYAIADHLRCMAFMFGDRITPSNIKEGYLARLVLRRTLRLMKEIGIDQSLSKLMEIELQQLSRFPEIMKHRNYILEVLELEQKRYGETLARGSRIVERLAGELKKKGEGISQRKLVELYDTHGLPPELVKEITEKMNVKVNIPEDFYIRVAELHGKAEPPRSKTESANIEKMLKGLRPTVALFYRDPHLTEFNAKVVKSSGEWVVLDQTAFYPEGGGQPSDLGTISTRQKQVKVVDVQKIGEVIAHRVKPNNLKINERIHGEINRERRSSLMHHHTATHILLGAARRVLGDHVWQHGVQKGIDRTRLDLSHPKPLKREELLEIERLANEVVMENRRVNSRWMDRNLAERKYGFDLYQGGVVPGKELRVVEIEGWNTQACGGTHCEWTGEVGPIKILRTERIQDGVERLEFAAGMAAVKSIQEREELLLKSADVLRSPPEEVASAVEKLFGEWKQLQKEIKGLQQELAKLRMSGLREDLKVIGPIHFYCKEMGRAGIDELIRLANSIVKEDPLAVVVLGNRDGKAGLLAMAGEESLKAGVDCKEIVSVAAGILGGGGGGKQEMAQGGGPKVEKLADALKEVARICAKQVGKV